MKSSLTDQGLSICAKFIHTEFKSVFYNPNCKNQGLCILSDVICCDLSFGRRQRKPVRTNRSIYSYVLLVDVFTNDHVMNRTTVQTHSRLDGNSGSFNFFCSKHIKLSIHYTLEK